MICHPTILLPAAISLAVAGMSPASAAPRLTSAVPADGDAARCRAGGVSADASQPRRHGGMFGLARSLAGGMPMLGRAGGIGPLAAVAGEVASQALERGSPASSAGQTDCREG